MFRLALRFLWVWGAGAGGTTPPVLVEGPYWVTTTYVHSHWVRPHIVRLPAVEPGRTFSDDPTLDTFKFWDGEG